MYLMSQTTQQDEGNVKDPICRDKVPVNLKFSAFPSLSEPILITSL